MGLVNRPYPQLSTCTYDLESVSLIGDTATPLSRIALTLIALPSPCRVTLATSPCCVALATSPCRIALTMSPCRIALITCRLRRIALAMSPCRIALITCCLRRTALAMSPPSHHPHHVTSVAPPLPCHLRRIALSHRLHHVSPLTMCHPRNTSPFIVSPSPCRLCRVAPLPHVALPLVMLPRLRTSLASDL